MEIKKRALRLIFPDIPVGAQVLESFVTIRKFDHIEAKMVGGRFEKRGKNDCFREIAFVGCLFKSNKQEN